MNDKQFTAALLVVVGAVCAVAGWFGGVQHERNRLEALGVSLLQSSQGVQSALAGMAQPTEQPQAASANVSGDTDHWSITGAGTASSAPFHLSGGAYTLTWASDCGQPTDFGMLLSSDAIPEANITGPNGTTHPYGVAAGDYVVQMYWGTGCSWAVSVDK